MNKSVGELKNYLERKVPTLKSLAIKDFRPEALVNVALWDVARTAHLGECSRDSILYCVKFAVQYGLQLGGTLGQCYMVPFKDKRGNYHATPVIGYRGAVQLVTEDGPIASVQAESVFEADGFEHYNTQDGPVLKHVPSLKADRGEFLGAYAVFRYRDRGIPPHIIVLPKSEIEKIRRSSKLGGSGPWVDWYEEMAKKSVINRGRKYIPLLPRAAEAFSRADAIESGDEPIEVDAEIEDVSKTEEIKNQLRARAKEAQAEPDMPHPAMPEPEEQTQDAPEREEEAASERSGRGRKPNAWHITATRQEIKFLLEKHGPIASGAVEMYTAGHNLPESWKWDQHATLNQLREIRDLITEEVNLA